MTTTLDIWARALTDAVLAERLARIADSIRAYTPAERDALLREAARRLRGAGE